MLSRVLIVLGLAGAGLAQAQQGLFQPVFRIGDEVITRYEIDQRALLLTLLGGREVPLEIVREQLINEAYQSIAARREGVEAPEEALIRLQEDFLRESPLTLPEFVEGIGREGVQRGTFDALFRSGLNWRDTIRQRYLDEARPGTAAIDSALRTARVDGGTRVDVAEILLPAPDAASRTASLARAGELRQLTDFGSFSEAARLFSSAGSRFEGGEIGWRPLSSFPEEAAAQLAGLSPGQVTRPVEIANAGVIALYQLRDRQSVDDGPVGVARIDYAQIRLEGRDPAAIAAEAAAITAQVQTCDDLYGVIGGVAGPGNGSRITRREEPLGAIAPAIRAALADIDPGETATVRGEDGAAVLVTLCAPVWRESVAVDREAVGQALTIQRLEAFAAGYMAELRRTIPIETVR